MLLCVVPEMDLFCATGQEWAVWAAWAQGIFSVIAILAAIRIANRQHNVQQRREVLADKRAARTAQLFGAVLLQALVRLQRFNDHHSLNRTQYVLEDLLKVADAIELPRLPDDAVGTVIVMRSICGEAIATVLQAKEWTYTDGIGDTVTLLGERAQDCVNDLEAVLGDRIVLKPADDRAPTIDQVLTG